MRSKKDPLVRHQVSLDLFRMRKRLAQRKRDIDCVLAAKYGRAPGKIQQIPEAYFLKAVSPTTGIQENYLWEHEEDLRQDAQGFDSYCIQGMTSFAQVEVEVAK